MVANGAHQQVRVRAFPKENGSGNHQFFDVFFLKMSNVSIIPLSRYFFSLSGDKQSLQVLKLICKKGFNAPPSEVHEMQILMGLVASFANKKDRVEDPVFWSMAHCQPINPAWGSPNWTTCHHYQ